MDGHLAPSSSADGIRKNENENGTEYRIPRRQSSAAEHQPSNEEKKSGEETKTAKPAVSTTTVTSTLTKKTTRSRSQDLSEAREHVIVQGESKRIAGAEDDDEDDDSYKPVA